LSSIIVSGNLRDVSDDAEQRARTALQRHRPALAEQLVVPLGQGLDNTSFLVEGLVVRVSESHGVVAEARLLDVVAPRVSVPVPQPRFVDDELGVMAYRLLPGRPLLGRSAFPGLADRLGRFLRELHSIDPAGLDGQVAGDDTDPVEWLEELHGPPGLLELLWATVPPRGEERVLVHGDLGAEHLLAAGGDLTGVIDWSDAALADPAVDFARLYRDFGDEFLVSVVDAYGGLSDAGRTLQRIQYYARCAALEDLEYGRTTGPREYADTAEASLRRLFESPELHLRG
jgi:aminoglycoside phosphotransferase (APT) family kinase protein